jgi:hypothetical protein
MWLVDRAVPVWAAVALLPFPACGFSIAGDAQADCDRLEGILSEVGLRCGGRRLDPAVLQCDRIVFSGMTSSDVDECQRWAEGVDCASLEAADWRPPEVCWLRAMRFF